MALKIQRKRPGPATTIPAGSQFLLTGEHQEPPGTVFGIDERGKRFVVERLEVRTEKHPLEPGAPCVQTAEMSGTSLGRLLGLPGGDPRAMRVVEMVLGDAEREVVPDEELDRALRNILDRLKFDAGTRYFVIRESWSATSLKLLFEERNLPALRKEFSWDRLEEPGPMLDQLAANMSEFVRPFDHRLGVFFRADEIALVRSGLAATAPELGRVEVTGALEFETPDYAVVRVLYATDRKPTGHDEPAKKFGVDRSELRYGTCDVSIPRDHRMGNLEAPSILKLQFRADPAKHVVLLDVSDAGREDFLADMKKRVAGSQSKSAFLFVHGYNVTFEDAARRTAQISYDLGFDGAPIFYSWPSQGTLLGYTVDEQMSEWSQPNYRSVLEDVVTRAEAEKLFLIAHSMGNRAVTRMVAALLNERPELRPCVTEIVLTAPDIDAEVFVRDIAPLMTKTGCAITLYASSEDKALQASKKIHKGRRLGDSGEGMDVVPGIETIDASEVDTSLIGHGYFAEGRSVIADMFQLIRNGDRAAKRFGLKAIDIAAGRYWVFKR